MANDDALRAEIARMQADLVALRKRFATTWAAVTDLADTANWVRADAGDMLFSADDGLLLWGPDGAISATEWRASRKQLATLSGAFRQSLGRWQGTTGLAVEPGSINLIVNPSFEVNLTYGWGQANFETVEISTDEALFGDYSLHLADSSFGGNEYFTASGDGYVPVTELTDYVYSWWAKRVACTGTGMAIIHWFEADKVTAAGQTNFYYDAGVCDWKRNVIKVTSPADAAWARPWIFYFAGITTSTEFDMYVDGVQFEAASVATAYFDGDQGTGYAWAGTDHESSSTRTATLVDLSDQAYLVSSNDTMTFRVVVQMPYDADAVWPSANNALFDIRGADNNNRVYSRFTYDSGDVLRVYINGAYRLVSGALAFRTGDWLDVVITCDFSADDYNLYINGVLVDNDTTSLTAPVLTGGAWHLGTWYATGQQVGYNIAEYAVFDRVLTANEIKGLYALQRPLVDAGGWV